MVVEHVFGVGISIEINLSKELFNVKHDFLCFFKDEN